MNGRVSPFGPLAALGAAWSVAVLCPPPVAAQVVPDPDTAAVPAPALPPPTPATPGAHVAPRERGTLVAVSVVIPRGSAADAEGEPGGSAFLAEVLAAGVRPVLPPGAILTVTPERDWTAFTLLAPPERWTEAFVDLAAGLFRDPVTDASVSAVRRRLLERFVFEEGAPVREFQREVWGGVAGAADLWARPPEGRPETLRTLGTGRLAELRREGYRPEDARVAIVGPVDEPAARRAVAEIGLGREGEPLREAPARSPWAEGRRVRLPREVTNAWIAVALPAAPGADRTALEMVAHQITERLNPTPPDPGVYSARAQVEDTPDGTVVLVQAAVVPEAANAGEAAILEVVDELERLADPTFFRWQRRRFRSHRLLEEAPPEREALRLTLDLLRSGRARNLPERIWALDPQALASAASALGEPRTLILGPDLAEESW